MSLAVTLHLLFVVIWIGGMFFALWVLRPVASQLLEPAQRLTLWRQSFQRFFLWVWGAVIVLPTTGYWIIFAVYGGMANVGLHIHFMNGVGVLMILLFLHIYFAPYKRLSRSVDAGEFQVAGKYLDQIRTFVSVNLILGLIVVVVAVAGKYL